jgi:hypothetical protein
VLFDVNDACKPTWCLRNRWNPLMGMTETSCPFRGNKKPADLAGLGRVEASRD